jgi:hypothetical protein
MLENLSALREKVHEWGLPSWTKFAFLDLCALAYLALLPTLVYARDQGIPAYHLFSLAVLVAPAFVALSILLAGPYLAWLTWFIWMTWKSPTSSTIGRHAAALFFLALLLFVGSMFVALFYGIVAPFDYLSYFAFGFLIIAVLVVVGACALDRIHEADEETNAARAQKRLWLLVMVCVMATSVSKDLAPVGAVLLRIQAVGGGFPVEWITNDGQSRPAALVLETGDGWFVRQPGRCSELAFVPNDQMPMRKWIAGRRDYLCHWESSYLDSGDVLVPNDPDIDNPDSN